MYTYICIYTLMSFVVRIMMAAGSKRRALSLYCKFHFSIRDCYICFTPKCTEEPDLCLCTTSVRAKRMTPHGGDFRLKNVLGRKIRRNSLMCGDILLASTKVVLRHRSDPAVHFDVENLNVWQICSGEKDFSARRLRRLQTCSSTGRMSAASSSCLH